MHRIRKKLFTFSILMTVAAVLGWATLSTAQVKGRGAGNRGSNNQPPRVVQGTLINLSPRGVSVKTDNGIVNVACNARTNWNVYARATQDVLKPGSVVQASGSFDWSNFYVMADAGLTLYVSNRPTGNGARISEDGRLVVTGQVVKTDPLVIQADRSCPPFVVRQVGNRAVGRAPVRGRNFQVGTRPGGNITVSFGKNLNLAGQEPDVRVSINVPGPNVAASVSLTRKGTIDPGELASAQDKKKTSGKKRGKKKDEKKDSEKKEDEKDKTSETKE